MDSGQTPDFDEAEELFCELLRNEGLELPDETRRYADPAEIVFIWHEQKRMVVLELEEQETILGLEPSDSCASYLPSRPPV